MTMDFRLVDRALLDLFQHGVEAVRQGAEFVVTELHCANSIALFQSDSVCQPDSLIGGCPIRTNPLLRDRPGVLGRL